MTTLPNSFRMTLDGNPQEETELSHERPCRCKNEKNNSRHTLGLPALTGNPRPQIGRDALPALAIHRKSLPKYLIS